jgi:hypothetical protein
LTDIENERRKERKMLFQDTIGSGQLNEMSNKELKNIISEILAEDLSRQPETDPEPK